MSVPTYRPPASARWRARASASLLRCVGWRVVLAGPVPARCVAVFYPHTSNWDFVLGLLAMWTIDLRFAWLAKDSLFRWPLARLLRRLGGIPVNRREHTGFIEHLARELQTRDTLRVVIAPEGTRSRTDHWKSGFYHLARVACMPLALGFIDYRKRELGIGAYVAITGDAPADMQRIAAFYDDKIGRRPQQQGPVRLQG